MTEENQQQNYTQYQTEVPTCKNCGITSIERDYLFPLCTECRDKLSKRKFPFGIKVFFVLIAVLLALSMSKFPDALDAGIHLQRGLEAETNKLYNTAMNEFELVTNNYPDSTVALAKLYVSYYYNDKIYESDQILQTLAGRELDDGKLISQVNEITDKIGQYYYYTDEFYNAMQSYKGESPEELVTFLKEYHDKSPEDKYVILLLADKLYDLSEFVQVKDLLNELVNKNPDYSRAALLLAATYRETGEYEKGIQLCDNVLAYNNESWSAYYTKSRLELKYFKDKKGLEYAQIAYNLDPENVSSKCNLALAYHFNNMTNDRDSIKDQVLQLRDTVTDDNERNYIESELNTLTQIISGEIKWRE